MERDKPEAHIHVERKRKNLKPSITVSPNGHYDVTYSEKGNVTFSSSSVTFPIYDNHDKARKKWKDGVSQSESSRLKRMLEEQTAITLEAREIIMRIVDYIDFLSRQQPVDKKEKELYKDMVESMKDMLGELPAWASITIK